MTAAWAVSLLLGAWGAGLISGALLRLITGRG